MLISEYKVNLQNKLQYSQAQAVRELENRQLVMIELNKRGMFCLQEDLCSLGHEALVLESRIEGVTGTVDAGYLELGNKWWLRRDQHHRGEIFWEGVC